MNLRDWKLVYGFISLVSKVASFAIAYFLDKVVSYSDLIDLFVGGLFMSSAFVHMLPRAESQINTDFPYASLVAVLVFAAFSLFCFIRDSIALMDENILTPCESCSGTSHLVMDADLLESRIPAADPIPTYTILDSLPSAVLYVAVIIDTIADGLWLSTLDLSHMHERTGVTLAMQFLEFIVIGKFIRALPIPKWAFWVAAGIASAASSILIMVRLPLWSGVHTFTGYASAVLLGIYFFLGAVSIHKAITTVKRSMITACGTLFLAFAIPAAIRAGDP